MIFQLLNKKPLVSMAIIILLIIIWKKPYVRHNFQNYIIILGAKVNFYHGIMNLSNIKSTFKIEIFAHFSTSYKVQ